MSERLEIKNARIESVSLGFEGHGILTAFVNLNYGGSGQGFGGYGLDCWDGVSGKRIASVAAGYFIARVLEVVGVDAWEKLPGMSVRVECEWNRIHRLGHFLEDKWFDPSAEFKSLPGIKS